MDFGLGVKPTGLEYWNTEHEVKLQRYNGIMVNNA
jgi:hypothetical protein